MISQLRLPNLHLKQESQIMSIKQVSYTIKVKTLQFIPMQVKLKLGNPKHNFCD